MQIVEDEDEQKCSPIKPKKRTQLDSPFKKNFLEDSEKSSSGQCCGAELDRGDQISLNLNLTNLENDQIIVTPRKGDISMNNKRSKTALGQINDADS